MRAVILSENQILKKKRVLKADKNLNETAIDTRACLYAPRNNFLVLVKRIHKVH